MKTSKTTVIKVRNYSRKQIEFLSPFEMAVFHHFSFTNSDVKTCKALNIGPDEFKRVMDRALFKFHYFFERFANIKEEMRLSIYPPKGKNRPIEILGLSTRVRHCLLSAEVYTVGKLCRLTEYDLKRVRGINVGSIAEIKKALRKNKLSSPLLR